MTECSSRSSTRFSRGNSLRTVTPAWRSVSRRCGPRSLSEPPEPRMSLKRFNFPENGVELYAEKVINRGLCAIAQAESLRYKLLGGLAVRRACYGVLRFVMESGAKGCEVIVSGKLRAQRAKSMKFKDGYMISSGQPVNEYIDSAVRHVLLRQGVLGIKVKIMLAWDPKGKQGPTTPLPDIVTIHAAKDEDEYLTPPSTVVEV
ncbi:small ribosomal subunit protein uS3x-like isoform X2 [Typha angustifolia]|uniref:small ribosomal subunit protein uS3x-like isoform X2 n=1 Tax=Typha angustifolia TaxID=59011 RepID=UPI003C300C18